MTCKLTDPVIVRSWVGETYSYHSLRDFFDNANWNIIQSLGDFLYTGKNRNEHDIPHYIVFDIYNIPVPSVYIQELYQSHIQEFGRRRRSKYSITHLPVYRGGPIDGVRNYPAGGGYFRSFSHYFPELRELNDLKHNEDAKEYHCFPRGKRVNKPNPWDDYKVYRSNNWKEYRKKQWKNKKSS